MFGRTPRLPIDVVFGSVLRDNDVVDYDVYVRDLLKDLKQAVTIARMTVGKQLKRHAALYNRKLKGAPVDVADRVLLANKGERGKRKLSDRWENSLYIVVDKNAETNTFKIENSSTGQVKIVHRNLIMPVNFLPFPDDVAEGPLSEDECVRGEETTNLEHLPQLVADERTVAWVSELECSSSSEKEPEMLDVDSVELPGVEDSVRLEYSIGDEADLDTNSNLTALDRLSSDADCQSDAATVMTVQSVNQNDVGGLMTTVRSRAERIIRPVVRFIETMQVQKFENELMHLCGSNCGPRAVTIIK